ncbi:MAG: 50S ribosomal protein L9, partial [Rhizobiales bacterium]|nr:50S ribosomal protein L9 [Hyphomicrobiales bacterium]
ANDANMKHFEGQRAQLEAQNLELKTEASSVSEKLEGQSFIAIRQAGDSGQLYGSVSPNDIAGLVTEGGFSVHRNQIVLDRPIKVLGLHEVRVALHPEVNVSVTVNVARTNEEAERQARGEDVTIERDDEEVEAELEIAEVFDNEAIAQAVLAEAEAAETGEDDGAGEDAGSESAAPQETTSEEMPSDEPGEPEGEEPRT